MIVVRNHTPRDVSVALFCASAGQLSWPISLTCIRVRIALRLDTRNLLLKILPTEHHSFRYQSPQ